LSPPAVPQRSIASSRSNVLRRRSVNRLREAQKRRRAPAIPPRCPNPPMLNHGFTNVHTQGSFLLARHGRCGRRAPAQSCHGIAWQEMAYCSVSAVRTTPQPAPSAAHSNHEQPRNAEQARRRSETSRQAMPTPLATSRLFTPENANRDRSITGYRKARLQKKRRRSPVSAASTVHGACQRSHSHALPHERAACPAAQRAACSRVHRPPVRRTHPLARHMKTGMRAGVTFYVCTRERDRRGIVSTGRRRWRRRRHSVGRQEAPGMSADRAGRRLQPASTQLIAQVQTGTEPRPVQACSRSRGPPPLPRNKHCRKMQTYMPATSKPLRQITVHANVVQFVLWQRIPARQRARG